MKRKCNTTRETVSLELQIDRYRRKLERERLIARKLDADLATLFADFSSKQALSRSNGRTDLSLSLAERRLTLKTEQIDELMVLNANLKAEIDTLRVALKQDRDFIATTKAHIATISLQAEQARAQGARHSKERHSCDLHYYSLSLSMPHSYSHKLVLSDTVPRPTRPVAFSLTPIPVLEAPLKGVFTHMVDCWKGKIARQREALERHRDYIGRLEEGFGRVQDCSLKEFVKLFLGWYETDLALRASLCLFQDEISTLEASVLDNQAAIQTLKRQQKDTSADNFDRILASNPHLSHLLSASDRATPAYSSLSTLQYLVETYCKGQVNLGKVAAIKASSLSDGFRACWPLLAGLHFTLVESGLGLKPLTLQLNLEELKQLTTEELLEALAALIYELDFALERLADFLRLTQRLHPSLQGNQATQSLLVTTHILEDCGPNYVLSTREFQARAAAKVAFPV